MSTSTAPNESETVARNKKICAEFFEGLFRDRNWGIAEKVMSPDYTYNGVPTTPASTVSFAKSFVRLMPGSQFTLEYILGQSDLVALRWSIDGKLFRLIRQKVNGTNILAVDPNGYIVSNWQSGGRTLLLQLLGLIERLIPGR